jgi:hypothetical protein
MVRGGVRSRVRGVVRARVRARVREFAGGVMRGKVTRVGKAVARRGSLALACLLLISSCSTGGSRFEEVADTPAGKALVYIYRPASLLGLGSGPEYGVGAGEERIVTLSAGGYHPYFAAPGRTDFWAHTTAMTVLTARLRAGEVYYLRGGIQNDIGVKRPSFELVSEAVGKQEIVKCGLLPAAGGGSE